jgi:glucokinase
MPVDWVVVGLDNGGTANNGTVLDSSGRFLLDRMAEVPSNVREGPGKAIQSLVDSVDQVLGLTGVPRTSVRAVSPALARTRPWSATSPNSGQVHL